MTVIEEMAKSRERIKAERDAMGKLLVEMDEYLSENAQNYIGSGSIFHRQMRELTPEKDRKDG